MASRLLYEHQHTQKAASLKPSASSHQEVLTLFVDGSLIL